MENEGAVTVVICIVHKTKAPSQAKRLSLRERFIGHKSFNMAVQNRLTLRYKEGVFSRLKKQLRLHYIIHF